MISTMPGELTTAKVPALAAVGIAGVAAVLAYKRLVKAKRRLPLPPGPPGLPIVGNIFDIPAEDFWWKYKGWSDQYGSDVIYLNILGTDIVVLNSLAACRELLEKRSSIYSSRPNMPMMNDLIGFDWHFGFVPYGDGWKERRKLFTQAFGPHRADQYKPAFVKVTRNFLLHVLDDPRNFREHTRLLAGAFILDITYGIEVTSKDDVYITQAERGMAAMAAAGTASSYIVDFLPSLNLLPGWFPGATFKRHAAAWRPQVLAMAREPLKYAEEALRAGNARPCVATELLQELDEGDENYEERKKVIHDVLASVYAAGSDTTVSSIVTFFLAMAQNPSIQSKAQSTVDAAFTTHGRLPDFSEYKRLPYIEALVREVLRWRPVTPIGVPHAVTQDDVYGAYCIPGGATVISNCYAIAHDPLIYGPDTEVFDPSRFMNASQTEIRDGAPMGYETFGFGRRVCPGLQIGVESIWLVVVSVLSAFNISREGGQGQKEREDFGKYTSGLLIHALPFEVQIVPRSKEAEALVRNGALDAQEAC